MRVTERNGNVRCHPLEWLAQAPLQSSRRTTFDWKGGSALTLITLRFTLRELEILAALAADQLFRKEFIDSRLPGCRSDAAELNIAKQLVQRIRLAAGKSTQAASSAR
jgi:hypothetical protein